jgi:hypothetical protein
MRLSKRCFSELKDRIMLTISPRKEKTVGEEANA